jgi:hypothetical protein
MNYIDYINNYILMNMDAALESCAFEYAETSTGMEMYTRNGNEYSYTACYDIKQVILKCSFQGFANDHPAFAVYNGTLDMCAGEYHPDIAGNISGYWNPYFTIPLTKEMSPFGK